MSHQKIPKGGLVAGHILVSLLALHCNALQQPVSLSLVATRILITEMRHSEESEVVYIANFNKRSCALFFLLPGCCGRASSEGCDAFEDSQMHNAMPASPRSSMAFLVSSNSWA